MATLIDMLLLALALGAGWLGWATLAAAGWRPAPPRRPTRLAAPALALRARATEPDH